MIKKALYSYPALSFRTHLLGSVLSQPRSSVITYHKGEGTFHLNDIKLPTRGGIVEGKALGNTRVGERGTRGETRGGNKRHQEWWWGGSERRGQGGGGGVMRWRDVGKKHSDVIRVERLHPASHTHPSTYERFMSLLIQCRSAAGGGHGYWRSWVSLLMLHPCVCPSYASSVTKRYCTFHQTNKWYLLDI